MPFFFCQKIVGFCKRFQWGVALYLKERQDGLEDAT